MLYVMQKSVFSLQKSFPVYHPKQIEYIQKAMTDLIFLCVFFQWSTFDNRHCQK